MAEVDRRGFLRLLRRSDKDEEEAAPEAEPAPDPEIAQLAALTESLLADLEAGDEERLAEAELLTEPYDRAYMRVTSGHIVFSVVTGVSAFMKTSDVVAFETRPPIENDRGHGTRVVGSVRAHHPADLPTVTRSYAFRFPAESPLIPAIRTACNLPEPEPEPELEARAEEGVETEKGQPEAG
jgi:hypothetical protein